MKNYGRKIIDYIFKKRSERPAICYESERKVQADSDRSDIRVFETGVSAQRHGDNRQSTRDAEEEECARLIEIAKAPMKLPYQKVSSMSISNVENSNCLLMKLQRICNE